MKLYIIIGDKEKVIELHGNEVKLDHIFKKLNLSPESFVVVDEISKKILTKESKIKHNTKIRFIRAISGG